MKRGGRTEGADGFRLRTDVGEALIAVQCVSDVNSSCRPWTVEEYRRFLEGLTAKEKSNWKAIAQDFVKTRNLM
ncbi:hypothetical protein Taro_033581 [Colocasia esculenta]|uniref:Myb-like domain-containing protein n=1 Tax=Colocasia esculenta TaxID=4460 RepID=A0A843WCY5_COLES|nr:hypothetical protein [Colocasia esculenta]